MQETRTETVGFRLSPQQQHLLASGGAPGAVQCAALLDGPVDLGRLREALDCVVARHEILRTTFVQPAGIRAPQQVIGAESAPAWSLKQEPRAAAVIGGGAALEELVSREAAREFDLEHGPLVRALLAGTDAEPGLLLLTASSTCADANSLLLLLGELCGSYRADGISDQQVQYADYAEWRHDLITGEEEQALDGRAFWLARREDRPAAPRLLFATPERSAGRWVAVPVALDTDELAPVRDAAQAAGVSIALFLEACWHALIARLTGASELVIAGWCDGRVQPDLERAVGPYAQAVPVRSRVEAETSFAEVLDQVHRSRAEAESWVDFASAEDLAAVVSESASAFVHFDLVAAGDPTPEVVALNPSSGTTLLLALRSQGEAVSAEVWHDDAVHSHQDAVDVARRFGTLVASAASDATRPVARMPIIDAAERQRLLAAAVGPDAAEASTSPVHHLFERQARLVPDAPAVADASGQLSYGQLNAEANRLAHCLAGIGVEPGAPVGLCMERTPALLEAVLGILKAGGAYVPLNYDHPQARLSHQLSEAGAKVLVTEGHLLERIGPFAGEVVCVDRDRDRIASFRGEDIERVCDPEDLVYVMYTSGSTGLPKGVAVTHGNLANYSTHIATRLESGRGMRFGVVSAISTDLGNTCIFPALVSGACVQLISAGASLDGEAMAAELAATPLDVLKITPSHLRAVLDGSNATGVLPRRWLVLGGEALSWDLVDRIRALSATCKLINHYGPTETTVGCCAYDVREPRADSATVPIGGALAGIRAYVLDSSLELLPPGVPGELCIGGDGVAAGYIGEGSDGSRAFCADPFSRTGVARMYRTGDRARYLRDGAIEFLGRVDDQVKIRGYRIEPGEVEARLVRHPAIRHAAVTAEQDDHGQRGLVAYLVASEQLTVEQLREFLRESLPDYMIPTTFATLEALPFTPSGKIDRKALRGSAEIVARREAEYVAPRTPLEQALADIWAQLLGLERVGVKDDFFGLGGHSLLAAQVVARVRSDLAVELPLHGLFAHPTISSLTSEIVRMMGDSEEGETARLVEELEGLSDDEAERLLSSELGSPDPAARP